MIYRAGERQGLFGRVPAEDREGAVRGITPGEE